MNTQTNFLLQTVLRSLLVLLFLLIIPQLEKAHAQTFTLDGREYSFMDGKWYNFSIGQKGDQIVPERLIVRLRDRGNLRKFDFAQVGLTNLRVISDELFGGYYVVE